MTGSRERHPSMAWSPDLDLVRRRLTERLRRDGAAWPDVGAEALVQRGVAGLDRSDWAVERRVPEEVVEAAEAGELPEHECPPGLLRPPLRIV